MVNPLTRKQLAEFLPDSRAVKLFEDLTNTSNISAAEIASLTALINAHILAHIAHGTVGNVVGDIDIQTLTNKTLIQPIIASIVNGGLLTLPITTDTIVGRATTDTFTNKTFDTGATGNVLKISGTSITGVTGTGNVVLSTSPTILTPSIASIVNVGTLTLPTSTDTLVGKATTDTFTNKTFDTAGAGNVLKINGTTVSAVTGTGSVVLATSPTITTPNISTIVNTGTLTLPTSTDTLIGKATTDTLTNKTFDTAGTGNVFKINGTTISANTGSGSNVLATSPTLTTPNIGAATGTSFTVSSGSGVEISLTGNTATAGILALTDTGGNGVGIQMTGNGGVTPNKYLRVNGGSFQVINSAYGAAILNLADDGTLGLGAPINTLSSTPTVASSGTIAPTASISFVSGTTTISTITAPSGLTNGGQITLIPTGLWATNTAGNIALASTAVVSKALILTYSASTAKWYPSY